MSKSKWQEYKEKNGVTPLDLLNPRLQKLSDFEQQKRMEFCDQCPELIPISKQCRKCGCFMEIKTRILVAKCPLGKW